MKTQVGKSTGIALLLAAGLLAALFAMGVFSPTSVGAGVSTDASVTLTNYNPSATSTLIANFAVNLPSVDVGTNIYVTIPTSSTTEPDAGNFGRMVVASTSTIATAMQNNVAVGLVSNDHETVTVSHNPADGAINFDGDSLITITITGLKNPTEIASPVIMIIQAGATVAGFDSSVAKTVDIAIEPTATLSSPEPEAAVRIEIDAFAEAEVDTGEDIRIKLTDFGVPSSISESSVLLSYSGEVEVAVPDSDPPATTPTTISYHGAPSEVSVTGKTITLTVPPTFSNGEEAPPVEGSYTIVFKQSAGITNPSTGGEKTIGLRDKDPGEDGLKVTIDRVIKLDKTSGSRGTEIEVTGKGFTSGQSATVYLYQADSAGVPTGARTNLGSALITDGTFELSVDTDPSAFKTTTWTDDTTIKGRNLITATDGANKSATPLKYGYFQIMGKVTLGKDSVAHSEILKITVSDWPDLTIGRVEIGGEIAPFKTSTGADPDDDPTDDIVSVGGDATEDFHVQVPASARTGNQTVSIYLDRDDASTTGATGSATVDVGVLALTLEPATAARGQEITITGSGFAEADDPDDTIESIMVSGEPVTKQACEVRKSGALTCTVTVPINVNDGNNTVKLIAVGGREGQATLMIPAASITVTPDESHRGTDIEVSGSGFIVDELVDVYYYETGIEGDERQRETSERADDMGGFTATFEVPSTAELGETNVVEAEHVDDGEVIVSATADHTTPDPTITAVPAEATPGALIIIKGKNLPLHATISSITIGTTGNDVTPAPKPFTDGEGSFSTTGVLVPQLTLDRTHTITVSFGTGTDAESWEGELTAVAAPAEPVATVLVPVSTDPADVFASLGDRLVRVWYLERATQKWSFYDPDPDVAAWNTLTEVSSDKNVSIIISPGGAIEFQGMPLYQGTNPIGLN